jgi:hypothetical protein
VGLQQIQVHKTCQKSVFLLANDIPGWYSNPLFRWNRDKTDRSPSSNDGSPSLVRRSTESWHLLSARSWLVVTDDSKQFVEIRKLAGQGTRVRARKSFPYCLVVLW